MTPFARAPDFHRPEGWCDSRLVWAALGGAAIVFGASCGEVTSAGSGESTRAGAGGSASVMPGTATGIGTSTGTALVLADGAAAAPTILASEIATGSSHSCALIGGGLVACWGDGSRGQLGDGVSGTGHMNPTPTVVGGVSGAMALRAGGDTTCAIVGSSVACWGDGTYGQLGDGTAGDGHCQTHPYLIPTLTSAVDLSISGQNVCAVTSDGATYCWGLNSSSGWLGFSSSDCGPFSATSNGGNTFLPCETKPRRVPSAQGAAEVAASGRHVCTRLSDGSSVCWGDDTFGQVGDGNSGASAAVASATAVPSLPLVQRLAVGAAHSCGLTLATAEVYCWGDNSYGQLGTGESALDSYLTSPTHLKLDSGVRDIDASGNATCAVTNTGGVTCWGNASSLLPNSAGSAAAIYTIPTAASGISNAVTVRTGKSHACIRHGDSRVACWGRNDHGQLGNGTINAGDYTMGLVSALVK